MARTEVISTLRIFVSSPEQIKSIKRAIALEAANLGAVLQNFGIDLKTISSADIRSGTGTIDAQEFIDSQVRGQYDIYLGLMWTRFGSPTSRSASGTEQEFKIALKALKSRKSNVAEVQFYFLDQPVAPSEIDPVQLGKVHAFKEYVGSQKVFHRTFSSKAELIKGVQHGLAKVAADLQKKNFNASPHKRKRK